MYHQPQLAAQGQIIYPDLKSYNDMLQLVVLRIRIGTSKSFAIQYNIDDSLTILYLNDIFNDTTCLPWSYFYEPQLSETLIVIAHILKFDGGGGGSFDCRGDTYRKSTQYDINNSQLEIGP